MDDTLDLTACDREPIHVPGSIQPHGLMLVVDWDLRVRHGAGDVEGRLGVQGFAGAPLASLIGGALADRVAGIAGRPLFIGQLETPGGLLDVSAHRADGQIIVELEPASPTLQTSVATLAVLEEAVGAFERASSLKGLAEAAATAFRRLIGYDRVMIYRFLDEGAGSVLAEDRKDGMPSFLNHHFPGSDIPRQARALYVRNVIRVIPDVGYTPAPLRPAPTLNEPLDMSDAALRSVSPIHLQYLRNMGVAASASVSIIKDGALWGLVACHNETPRQITYDVRAACRSLAGSLSRVVKAKEEAEGYRERIRLRSFEDEIVALLSREGTLHDAISNHVDDVRRALGGDGVAIRRGGDILMRGACPPEAAVRALSDWLLPRGAEAVFATERLPSLYPPAREFQTLGSGLLAIILSIEEPWIVMWFRAEHVEVVNWAGNPHKDGTSDGDVLTPRASFEAWNETVRGQARRWSLAEIEAAGRLRQAVLEVWQNRRLRDLNRQLMTTVHEKDLLIQQKQFLIGEVNHRVQNSLTLVSSFLALQARGADDPALVNALGEARRRLGAVALVHRRLYRTENVESVDAAHYLEELCSDMVSTIDGDWAGHVRLDLEPVMVPTDRAVAIGLILTELIINAAKYAYGGDAGPLDVRLSAGPGEGLRLVVADQGVGKASTRRGFGSRMMDALVAQLAGELVYESNKPGLRATLSVPPIPR